MPRPKQDSQTALPSPCDAAKSSSNIQQSLAKKRGCCEERQQAGREREETSDTEQSQTASQPTSPAHQSLVFANALRDSCKKGLHRLLDPRGCIVSDDLMTITRKPQRTHCFVIGETPLKFHSGNTEKGWFFEVQIEAVIPGQNAGLGIGVTTATSSKIANLDWRARAVPESFVAGYWGQVSASGRLQPVDWQPQKLAVKDRVGFLVSGNGDCTVYVNRTQRVFIEKLVPNAPLSDDSNCFYALVDIFSCTSSVTFLDSTPPKRSTAASQEKLPAAPPVAPVQSHSTAPKASAKEQPVTRQDLKEKLAKKLACKALVRGRKPPLKVKHRDVVEVLKGRAAAEKVSVQSESAVEEAEQGPVNPVPNLTMYQTCVLARLAAEKKLRLNNKDSKAATADNAQKAGDSKCADNYDAEAVISVSDPKACSSQAEPSSSSTQEDKSKSFEPIVEPDPKIDGTPGTQESSNCEVLSADSEQYGTQTGSGVTFPPVSSEAPEPAVCSRPGDHQQSTLNGKEDLSKTRSNETDEDKEDLSKTRSNETYENAAYEAEVSCGRQEDQQNSEQDKGALLSKSGNSIKAIDSVDYVDSVKCPKHADHKDSGFEEKEEEEASSSSQPEEEPQISNAEVEPAPEASPVASPPLTYTRSADPLWLVPGVPRKCGMAGYLSVCCMGAALYSDDDRVEVLCTEGCAAVFHAACYKCFRRPPDRSCLDPTCTGKLCRVWKTSCLGEVTNVFDLKQEPECQLQASGKSSASNAKVNSSSACGRSAANSEPGVSAEKAAKTADSQSKASRGPAAGAAQRSGKAPLANSCSKGKPDPPVNNAALSKGLQVTRERDLDETASSTQEESLGRGSASSEPGVMPAKKKQEATHVPQAAATECLNGLVNNTDKESLRVNGKTERKKGLASRADTTLQPTARVEQATARGPPSQSMLQLAARMCKTGDFMLLAPWSSRQHRGQQEMLRVPKGGVVYVGHVDEQGWALATCRLTRNSGWLPYDFLCRCIYTASQKFSNSIGGYSVIAKGDLISVFYREGCWVYGAALLTPAKEFRDVAGEEDQWKEIGWYPADLIGS